MPTGSIPEVHAEMLAMAEDPGTSPELRETLLDWIARTKRRSSKRAAPVTKAKVTANLVLGVLYYYSRHPRERAQDIGAQFNLDGGRVSEIIAGEKDHLLDPSIRYLARRYRASASDEHEFGNPAN